MSPTITCFATDTYAVSRRERKKVEMLFAHLRRVLSRGARMRIWRDTDMAQRVRGVEVEAQPGGRVQDVEIRSKAPSGGSMQLKRYWVDHCLCFRARPGQSG